MMEKKVIAGFAATAFILSIFGYYSILQMRELSNLTKNMYDHPLAVTNATKTIQIKFLTIRDHLYTLLEVNNPEAIEQINRLIHDEEKEILSMYALIFERYLGKKEDIQKSYESFLRWHKVHLTIIQKLKAGKKAEVEALLNSEITDKLNEDIKTLIDFAKSKSEYFLSNAIKTASQTIIITMVIVFGAIIAIILGALWLTNNIRHSRIKLQESQKEFERKSRELLQAQKIAKLGIWRWEIPTDSMFWDDNMYAIFEREKNVSLDTLQSVLDAVHPEDMPKIQKALDELFEEGKSYPLSYRILTYKGNVKNIKVQYQADFDEENQPVMLFGVVQDVTEETVSQEHLLHQSRLAQMGEMISMIAHQWRQPLGAIASTIIDVKMQIELQTYDLSQKKEQKEFQAYLSESFHDMEQFVKNLTTTIDDFRNFYKQHKKSETISLAGPIRQSIELMKNALEADGIDVQMDYLCTKRVNVYPNEIIQVILNLLKNAMENFHEKGSEEAKIKILCIDTTEGVDIQICDNGGGIPEKIISKIFDPYFSTKNEKNGTGLGLYMSKIIIEEHHAGQMKVCNQDDGACFTLSFRSQK